MSHYFVSDPNLKEDQRSFDYIFNNEKFVFTTDSGVFCKEHIDYGSYLLLKQAVPLELDGNVLDLGCGFGPIGIILKRFHPDIQLDAVDVNNRAVALTELNARLNVTPLNAYLTNDIRTLAKQYNTILLNPPIRAGKAIIYDLYQKSHDVLAEGGSLYVVIRRKQGAESSLRKLKDLFNTTEVLNKESGYWILRATRMNSDVQS